MPRFFMAGSNLAGGAAVISGQDADHVRVLRMKLGEKLVISDGEGTDYTCVLSRLGDGMVEARVVESEPSPGEASIKCTVLAGFSKGDRSDYTVQKCVESGASDIVFFPCERCVSRPDGKSLDKKISRWQRIAEEAAKQAGRGIIPTVSAVSDFAGAIDLAIKTELPLFLYETGERVPLKIAVENAGPFASAAIITGPEGGFEPFEAELARLSGITICSMGSRILRCETAPVTALTALMYATGNL